MNDFLVEVYKIQVEALIKNSTATKQYFVNMLVEIFDKSSREEICMLLVQPYLACCWIVTTPFPKLCSRSVRSQKINQEELRFPKYGRCYKIQLFLVKANQSYFQRFSPAFCVFHRLYTLKIWCDVYNFVVFSF